MTATKPLNVPIPKPLDKRLQKHSKESGRYIKKIVELALTDYLDKKDQECQKNH